LNALAAKVIGELHESEPIYVVLDGARSPSVQAWALSDGAPAWCLYREPIAKELQAVAPYLRRVGRGHAETDNFFQEAWGAAWGVLFSCPAPSKELRRHMRRFLRARTEEGSVLVFRWFDPRVLREFLPTLTRTELKRFFGPITAFAVEADTDGSFHIFRSTEAGLSHKLISAPPGFEVSEFLHSTGDSPEPVGNDPASPARQHLLWTLSAASMRGLTEKMQQAFVERMITELGGKFPLQASKLGRRLNGQISRGMAEAQRSGLSTFPEIAKYLNFWFEAEFNLETRWPGSRKILENPALPGTTKLKMLAQYAD